MHDALWHLSLVSTAFKQFPFIHPEFAGANLVGYNYLLDLLIYTMSSIGLSPLFIFFQLLPVLTAILFIYLVIKYIVHTKLSDIQANTLAFFLFFGSSFSYLATLHTGATLYYSSMRGFPVVTSIQPGMIFLNIQFALSLCTILMVMMTLRSKLTFQNIFLIGLLTFITAGLKFYGGAMLFGYIGLTLLFKLFKDRQWKPVILTMGSSILGLFLSYLFFYVVPGSKSFPFDLAPFAITHLMIEDVLLFYDHNMTLARYFLYENSIGFSPRLWGIELYSIILFLLINFGTRIFGLISTSVQAIRRRVESSELVLLVLVMLSTLIPILFVQEGGWYNTTQFLYYGVFFASFLSFRPLAALFSSHKKHLMLIGVIWILLTIPNHIDQLRYLTEKQNVITDGELSALSFLKDQPKGVVYQSGSDKENSYVSALAAQQSYFVDIDQLMVTHVDYESRAKTLGNPSLVLSDTQIQYVYINKSHANADLILQALDSRDDFISLFDNNSVIIYGRIL